jgi:tetratricopeptide (TPR) repeat protein
VVVYEEREGYARYRLLETIRQYAADRLRESGEWAGIHGRHRDYFLQWAEAVEPKLWEADQALWFSPLEVDRDNFRAALEWSRLCHDAEMELRLVVALCRFWDTHGHLRDGRAQMEAAVARMAANLPPVVRANALLKAGWVAYAAGDYAAARVHYELSVATAREGGELKLASDALNVMALATMEEGDLSRARQLYEESLAVYRELGRDDVPTVALANIGTLALLQGDYDTARDYLTQSAARYERSGSVQGRGLALLDLSAVDYCQGRYEEARERGMASLRLLHSGRVIVDIPRALDQMALLAHAAAEWERAARLLGAAEGLREEVGASLLPSAVPPREEAVDATERALGAGEFAAAFAAGRAMDMEQAVAYVFNEAPDPHCEEGSVPKNHSLSE